MHCSPEYNSLCCSERRFLMKAVVSYSIGQSYKQSVCVCVQAGGRWQAAGDRGKQTFFIVVGKALADTPLFGLYGYVPLNRVWFSGS